MKILIIEDDVTLNRLLVLHLTHKGYEVVSALGGMEGLLAATRERPDLVLLDVMMPVMDGWEVLQRLRQESDVPVVLLTAKVMTHDVIHGLQLGADDYIRKPFNLQELDLRLEAVLRRAKSGDAGGCKLCYDDGRLYVDADQRLVLRGGEEIHLSPTEFRLLCYLIEHRPRVMAHEQILTHVWGPEYAADVGVLSVYIRYLRQKLEDTPSQPRNSTRSGGWGIGSIELHSHDLHDISDLEPERRWRLGLCIRSGLDGRSDGSGCLGFAEPRYYWHFRECDGMALQCATSGRRVGVQCDR